MKRLIFILLIAFLGVQAYSSTDLTSKEALNALKEGSIRFSNGNQTFSHLNQSRRKLTSEQGQHPFATVIACSDSRVPVEEIFDVGIGDIFTIRVAGNVVAVDEAGSIEYGVDHLKTPVLVVLGHSGCGAVTAVCQNAEVHGNIPQLVDNIIPAVEKARHQHGNGFTPALLNASITNNVWQSIEDLLKISHTSADLVKSGQLMIVGAIYHLEDGHIEWLGEHPDQANLLASNPNTHSSYSNLNTHTPQLKPKATQTQHVNQNYNTANIQVENGSNSLLNILFVLGGIILLIYFLLFNKQTALKLSLRGKILALVSTMLVLLGTISILNSISLNSIGEEIKNIAEEDIILTEYITEIEKGALEQEIVIQKILTQAHDGVYKNRDEIINLENEFRLLSEEVDKHLSESIELCQDVIGHATNEFQLNEFNHLVNELTNIDIIHETFEENAEVLFKVVNANNRSQLEQVEHSIEAEAENIAHQTASILENIAKFTEKGAKRALQHEKEAMNANIIISLAAMVIGLLIGFVISSRIAIQLGGEPEEVADISNNMAIGNLAFDIDQYGKRTGAMNDLLKMTVKMKDVVSTIITGAGNISSASLQLSSSSQQISSGVNEQAASSEEVSSSMEEMTANIQQNTENASQTREISGKASNAMEQVAVASEDSMNAVKNIYSKINVVVEIAEKTDLLAINAAVEAARAGDQGRGFAVVAAEVRKLAERSQNAANEIVELAEKGMKLTEESTLMLKDIVPDIQQTSRLVDEIASSSQEQDSGAMQVNTAIQQLTMVTQQNASAAEEMASGSEEMASQAAELEDITNHFTIEKGKVQRNQVGHNTKNSFNAQTPTNGNGHHKNSNHQFDVDLSTLSNDTNGFENM